VVSGVGGGHGNAWSNLLMNLLHVLSGTGGYMAVFSKNQDKHHALGSHGGPGNAYSPLMWTRVPAARGAGREEWIACSLNVASGHGGYGSASSNQKLNLLYVLPIIGGHGHASGLMTPN
jgi:hypothetical protein